MISVMLTWRLQQQQQIFCFKHINNGKLITMRHDFLWKMGEGILNCDLLYCESHQIQIQDDVTATRWCQIPQNKTMCGNYDPSSWVSCRYNTDMSQNAGTGRGTRGVCLPFVLTASSPPMTQSNRNPKPVTQHLCVFFFQRKKRLPTFQHNRKAWNSGWRRGRRVRLQHTGSCCTSPHLHPLASWPWEHTCSTCWCADRSTPSTSGRSCRPDRLLQTICEKLDKKGSKTSNIWSSSSGCGWRSSHQLSDVCRTNDRTVIMWQIWWDTAVESVFQRPVPWQCSLPERSHQCFKCL